MLQSLVLLLFGFALGVISLGVIIVYMRTKDEVLIQDLLDRITARTPGDYLSIIHFRKEHMAQKPGLLFDALKKKVNTKVPTLGEIEMEQAKMAAINKAKGKEFETDEQYSEEFNQQQETRFRRNKSDVIA